MPTLMGRRADWMYDALRLDEPQIPIDLHSELVVPVVDYTQDGWGFVEIHRQTTTLPASSPAVNLIVLNPIEDRTQTVMEIEVDNEQSAVTWNFFLRLVDPIDLFLVKIARGPFAPAAIPANGIITSQDVFQRKIVVPAGWQLEAFFDGTGVGDTKTTRILSWSVPDGMRPL